MLKGKPLYEAARAFADDILVPGLDDKDMTDEKTTAVLQDSATLGIALLVDVAESLHKISTKVG